MIFEVDGVDIDDMLKEMNKGKIEIRNKDGVKIISCATCDDKDKQITELKQIVEVCKEALKTSERVLDKIKFELYASVYTLEDDEFEKTFFIRDVAQQALDKISELTKDK